MCDLFGMSCQEPDRAIHSLSSFREFSVDNPDGWGIAYFENGKARIEKEPIKAKKSEKFDTILQKITSKVIISHIRLSSCGEICTENCHPFKRTIDGRDWIFAHNGTISNISSHHLSKGTTDSEPAFHLLMDDVNSYVSESDFRGLYPGIKSGIKQIFKTYSRNITFNFLLSDGSILYAFNHYLSKPLYISKREKAYGGAIVVSTQKLDSAEYSSWRKIPKDKLILISNGRVLLISSRL